MEKIDKIWSRLDTTARGRVVAIGLCAFLGIVNGIQWFFGLLIIAGVILAISWLWKSLGLSIEPGDISNDDHNDDDDYDKFLGAGYRDGDQGYGYYSHDGWKIHD